MSEELRTDGRRPLETRRMRGTCGYGLSASTWSANGPDGVAFFAMGGTRALAEVFGPGRLIDRRSERSEKGVVHAFFATAAFAGSDRRKRSRFDRIENEAEKSLVQSIEAAVLLDRIPRSVVSVRVSVLQSDGSARACALNAASLALLDAGVPVRGIPAACGACFAHHRELLDPCGAEAATANPELTVCSIPHFSLLTGNTDSATDESCDSQHPILLVGAHMTGRSSHTLYEQLQQSALRGCVEAARTIRRAALSRMETLHSTAAFHSS